MKKLLIRFFAGALTLVCLLGLGVCAVVGAQGYQMYQDALAAKPLADAVAAVRAQPDYTPLSELPALYKQAVVAVEDHRFYSHGGVDFLALARALWNDLKAQSFVQGGSTITQQLAKNLFFTQEKRLTRKVAEALMAWEIEKYFSKDEILELYVNAIYFGSGCDNVRQAARCYFGKEPAEMTAYECTMLAGIPNAPSIYDPSKNPALAARRQREVVRVLERRGILAAEETAAILTPVAVQP